MKTTLAIVNSGILALGALALIACDTRTPQPAGGYIPPSTSEADTSGGDVDDPDVGTDPDGVTPDPDGHTDPDTPMPDSGPDATPDNGGGDPDASADNGPDSGPDNGGGDPDVTPDNGPDADPDVPPVLPSTVEEVQAAAETAGCNEDEVTDVVAGVTLTVVVTGGRHALVEEDGSGNGLDGYYVRQPGGDASWDGLLVTVPASAATDFQVGDVVEVTGDVVEFHCHTQLEASAIAWVGTDAAEPIAVDAGDLAAESYESALVTITSIVIGAEVLGGVYETGLGFDVSYGYGFFLTLTPGETYTLTGVLKWNFGKWALIPRSPSDVVFETLLTPDTTIKELQSGGESVTCSTNAKVDIGTVVLDGTISVGKHYAASTLDGYYLTDETTGAYSGLYLVVPNTWETEYFVGDQVRVMGVYSEYYCMSEVTAEVVEVLGTGLVPDPVLVDPWTYPEGFEGLEGMVITIQFPTVTSTANYAAYGEVELDSGLLLDDGLLGPGNLPAPTVGYTYSSITGAVTYAFGAYRINPRTLADLE